MGKERRGGGGSTDGHPTPPHPPPRATEGAHFGLVSIVQTSQDGSHLRGGGKLSQATLPGRDLPLLSQAGGLEGRPRGEFIHNRRKERRKSPLYPHPCTPSPPRKNGTPELRCSGAHLQQSHPIIYKNLWGPPHPPPSPGPARRTRRVGGWWLLSGREAAKGPEACDSCDSPQAPGPSPAWPWTDPSPKMWLLSTTTGRKDFMTCSH